MNYQTINAKELTQKAVEKHGSQSSVAKNNWCKSYLNIKND